MPRPEPIADRYLRGYLPEIERCLVDSRSPERAAVIVSDIVRRFGVAAAEFADEGSPVLRGHLGRSILPGVTLYQALCEDLGCGAAALLEAQDITDAVFARGMPSAGLLKWMPGAFGMLRLGTRVTLKRSLPPEGWDIEWTLDQPGRFTYVMTRCFYFDACTRLGSPEATAIFCHADEVDFAKMPEGIRWDRPTKISVGDDCCEFRFWRE